MSFLSVLKAIGHGLSVGVADADKFSGVISAIPTVGPIASTVLNSITAVEGLVTANGTGAAKKSAVVSIVNAVHPGLDQATLGSTIDAVVAGLNALSAALATAGATTISTVSTSAPAA